MAVPGSAVSNASPRIDDGFHSSLKIRNIARNEREIACRRCCSDEGVGRADGLARRFALGRQPAPYIGNRGVEWQHPALEAQQQLLPQPPVKPTPALSGCHALNAVAQLGQSDDADEDTVLVGLRQPGNDTWIGARPHPLGDHRRAAFLVIV